MESIAGPSSQTFQKPAANLSNRIFLGNLSDDLEEAAIKSYCKTWGELVECRVMREPKSKKSRGFGFLAYKSDISASHFMNGRPHYIGDKKIDVKLVVPAIRTQAAYSAFPVTNRIFVSISDLDTQLSKFELEQHFAAFGPIAEISLHSPDSEGSVTSEDFSRPESTSGRSNIAYAILDFLSPAAVEKCLKSENQAIGPAKLGIRKIVTSQSVAKRKFEIRANEVSFAKEGPPPAKIPTLLSSNYELPVTNPIPASAKEYVAAPMVWTRAANSLNKTSNDPLRGYGYQ
ncbi:RNA recognition motif domain-containing protein [Ditylenchus destructor]|uniref:RNA recognition motif domain-containing protein n=1 Tax=Ditylenchus destructor TaxID=166010 RepID=A0AAD4MNY9_9BILA|nr:RNA recognition motif domain-containing protein [Ditylenchus destructor]